MSCSAYLCVRAAQPGDLQQRWPSYLPISYFTAMAIVEPVADVVDYSIASSQRPTAA